MVLHVKLPDHHLDGDSRDVVKLVIGLIATMAALVLSLLIASANSSYDRQSSELKTLSTNILLLDRTLKFYGIGAKEARDGLRDAIVQTHNRIWSREGVRPENLDSRATQKSVNANIEQLLNVSPKTDAERMMQSRAVQESEAISQSRLLMLEQLGGSIPWPFLTVLIFWICVLFSVSVSFIGQQLRQEIAAALRPVPEMMVRIDDRQFRLERGFLRPARQPGLQLGVVAVGQPAVFAFRISGHVPSLKDPSLLGYFIVPAQAETGGPQRSLPGAQGHGEQFYSLRLS